MTEKCWLARHLPISSRLDTMHVLGHLTVDEFLRDYWQKKPVLIRNAIPSFEPLIPADELAGLSLEEDIESRLIIEEGKSGPWEVKKGPFNEDDFRSLPEHKWTLLVQAVDHWLPEAASLLDHFRFIPTWRIDDLMISYATDGGSVGPHYDQYDVFLLQAEGQREWRIGQMCSERSSILDGPSVKILADFEETDRWVLNPGDMLYLPPGLAHWGISRGECMTYSVGFRAPSTAELLERSIDQILPELTQDNRYTDADLTSQPSPGEITETTVARLKQLLSEAIDQPERLSEALGTLMTEPKYEDHAPAYTTTDADWTDTLAALNEYDQVCRSPHARFAYSTSNTRTNLYCQGECVVLPASSRELVRYLCDSSALDTHQMITFATGEAEQRLITDLFFCDLIGPAE